MPKIGQRTFEQLQVVDVLAVCEVKLVPQERVQQRCDSMEVGNVSRSRWTHSSRCMVGRPSLRTGLNSPLFEQVTVVESGQNSTCHF